MATEYVRKVRGIPRDVWLVMVPYVTLYFLYFGIYGVAFNLYLLRMGLGARYVGLVNAAGWLTFTVISPVTGLLGRAWGVRRTMLLGMVLSLVGFTLVALADLLPTAWQAPWALVTYVLGFMGVNGALVSSQVYVVTRSDPAVRDHAFAVRQAAGPLSAAAGGLLSGVLPGVIAPLLGVTTEAPAPFRYVLLGGALVQVVGLVVLLPIQELVLAEHHQAQAGRGGMPLALIAAMTLFGLLWWVGRSPTMIFTNVYLDDGLGLPAATIGLIQAAGQFVRFPVALLVPLLVTWGGHRRVVIGSTLAMGLLMVPLALLPHPLVAGLCVVAVVAAFGVSHQANSVYAQELVATEWRPMMAGTLSMATGLGNSAMALGGGAMIATLGYVELFLMGAAAALLAVLCLQALVREPGVRARVPVTES